MNFKPQDLANAGIGSVSLLANVTFDGAGLPLAHRRGHDLREVGAFWPTPHLTASSVLPR